MSKTRTEFGFERIECACEACTSFCFRLPGALIPTDLDAISTHLGYDDLVRFAVENLLASPGALVSDGKTLFRVPTLVPQRRSDGGECKFLRDNLCSIHAVSPYSCSHFSSHQDQREADARSLRGLQAIAYEWAIGGLYAQLWILLFSKGLVAPSPVEVRERMKREMQEKKNRADDTSHTS